MAIRWKIIPRVFHSIVIIVLIEFSCVHSIKFKRENFVFWPNGTVPFYVNTKHFDKEQTLAILSTLSDFAHKTCLKFRPVVAGIHPGYHVLSFENQDGVRRCVLNMEGHAKENPHLSLMISSDQSETPRLFDRGQLKISAVMVHLHHNSITLRLIPCFLGFSTTQIRLTVGYSCLRSPHLQMLIMKALGFPFEHNRMGRDLYIDVQFENIQPGFRAFFTKEKILPEELRDLPYDINSVMHFGERDYSKNGHRSFFIKNHKTKQSRIGLSKLDIIKIDLIYGPECKKRDRQAKIDICKEYPTVRRKRETELDLDRVQNLRINRDITPPPEKNLTEEITESLKELNIDEKVQDLIEQVHKITAAALENERFKLCNPDVKARKSENNTVPDTQYNRSNDDNVKSNDITKIIEVVINHVKEVVNNAKTDLTVFCNTTNNIELFQRARCGWGTNNRCPLGYKSTKSGAIRYSTKHRPYIRQSTKHERASKPPYVNLFRSGNDSEDAINATSEKRKQNISNDNMKTIDRLSIATNNTRADIDLSRPKKESNIVNNNDLNKGVQIRNKREADTIILPDDINNVTEKNNESPGTKTINEVTGSLVKIDATANNVINVNGSKDSLRMATKVFADKKVDFAPARRNNRDDQDFSHSRNEESDREDKSGDSTSTERHKIKQRTTKRKRTRERDESREREEERPRKWDRNMDENRPQNKRVKSKRGRQRHLPETVPLTEGNKEFYAERIWPNGVVRYVITPDSTYNLQSVRARLAEVNDILKKKTCVRIEEISERKGQRYKDYLIIDSSPDYVTGRVGGRQNFGSIELFEGGQHRQHAAMMVMAMLGFYFESARHDRDQYVRVHNRHIRPDKLHHFEKIRPEANLNLPYDYASATHPAWQFWRRVGRTGISSVATYKDQDPDGSIMKSLGQNEQLLSNLDIIKINSVYGLHCFTQRPIANQ